MPYTSPQDRKHIGEEMISGLINAIKSVPSGKWEVNCVYVIIRIVLGVMTPRSWTQITKTKAIFTESRDEIQRRLMGLREDQAIIKNGDLKELS